LRYCYSTGLLPRARVRAVLGMREICTPHVSFCPDGAVGGTGGRTVVT